MAKLKGKGFELIRTKPKAVAEKFKTVDMTRSDAKTYIGLVLDSSGSMVSHYEAAVRGFNKNLEVIRKTTEHDAYVWLCLFGTPDSVSWPIVKGEVADLTDLNRRNYLPYGSTPLLDAIGATITELEGEDRYDEKQGFLVIAFSDGDENASRAWNWHRLGVKVKEKDDRWSFVFVGPKHDHYKFMQAGYKEENLLEWKDVGVKRLMERSSFALGRFLTARNAGKLLPAFFDRDG